MKFNQIPANALSYPLVFSDLWKNPMDRAQYLDAEKGNKFLSLLNNERDHVDFARNKGRMGGVERWDNTKDKTKDKKQNKTKLKIKQKRWNKKASKISINHD
jgi:hypothetical protein